MLVPPHALPSRRSDSTALTIKCKTHSPVLGGGAVCRKVDLTDPIRASSIRGALAFWWRALNAPAFSTPQELREAEEELWGGVFETSRRSLVSVCCTAQQCRDQDVDGSDIGQNQDDSYALWPARKSPNVPPAERLKAGFSFELRLTVTGSQKLVDQVSAAVAAWTTFGGYGGRCRRGCGSVTVLSWTPASLPQLPSIVAGSLKLPFTWTDAGGRRNDQPVLSGSRLWVGPAVPGPQVAWHSALSWIRDFRQRRGATTSDAREQGQGNRPGRSRWPEPDKMRAFGPGKRDGHHVRMRGATVWPRAGFGLPIIARFQDASVGTIKWCRGDETFERLASPLITKAMAVRHNGSVQYVPIALWLARGYPEDGRPYLDGFPMSAAQFDQALDAADCATPSAFRHLVQANGQPQGARLLSAFTGWMASRPGVHMSSL